jgi:hypothetical protein
MSVWAAEVGKYRLANDDYDNVNMYEANSSAIYASPLDSDYHAGVEGMTFEANGQGLKMTFGINNEWAPGAVAWLQIV